ncbi:MAG: ABC transporter ATP-binding protein [Caldiserica bacterium]|nr:MAG: ABC transporter ATP-binding protein [Caldisericota bacterium]RLD17298.1 MAG: ABC transporter ATP-binding protein [Caldisericota bacterium]
MGVILSVENIVKIYPNGVIANRGVSVEVEENTIHAIVGENGAGKTTLMKVIFGIEKPQEGKIYYKGKEIHIRNPLDAIKIGIGMVHQHLMLAPDLTVSENLVLGSEPLKGKFFLDTQKAIEITKEVSKNYGLDVPAEKKIKDLPIGIKQRVEILKALFRNAELLILDEPTSVLTPQETEVLFKTLKELKKHGKTIIFISHKLKEVKEIADKVTVMRDGKVVATKDAKDLTEHDIAYLMVGREISFERIPPPKRIGEPLLTVRNLSYVNEESVEVLKNISFEVRAGEILGIAGVEGNGQTELVEILTGLREATTGEVLIKGENILGLSPRKIREKKVSHIPEDRMKNGVADKATLEENFIVDRYYKSPFSKGAKLDWKYIQDYSNKLIKDFNVLASSPKATVSSLSGGNIQKVVVARELSSNPMVLIADQPTRGIDVGSEELVHNLLMKARDEGSAVFLVSADLDEVLKLSTRIVVIYNGEIVARFNEVDGLTGKDLGPYMLGIKREE